MSRILQLMHLLYPCKYRLIKFLLMNKTAAITFDQILSALSLLQHFPGIHMIFHGYISQTIHLVIFAYPSVPVFHKRLIHFFNIMIGSVGKMDDMIMIKVQICREVYPAVPIHTAILENGIRAGSCIRYRSFIYSSITVFSISLPLRFTTMLTLSFTL